MEAALDEDVERVSSVVSEEDPGEELELTVRIEDEEHRIKVWSAQPLVKSLWAALSLSEFETCQRVCLGEEELDLAETWDCNGVDDGARISLQCQPAIDWDSILIALESNHWDGTAGLCNCLTALPEELKKPKLCADLLSFTFTDWRLQDKMMTPWEEKNATRRGNPEWLTKEGNLHYTIVNSGTSGSMTVAFSRYKRFTDVAHKGITLPELTQAYARQAVREGRIQDSPRTCTAFFERLAERRGCPEVAYMTEGKGKGKGKGGKEGPLPRGEKGDSGTGKGGKVETRKRYVL